MSTPNQPPHSDSQTGSVDRAAGESDGPPVVSDQEVSQLREKYYNATIIERTDTHSDLARFRVRPDDGFEPFAAGQYVALGLGNWESRLEGCQSETLPEKKWRKLVRRAYSIACPMVNLEVNRSETCLPGTGHLLDVNEIDYLEFFVALVRQADSPEKKPPGLTPRLFNLSVGDRIEVAHKIVGHYVVAEIAATDTVLMIATGTGEAPHNAMTTSLLAKGHQGKIVNVTSVRKRQDLAYLSEHKELMRRHENYRYLHLTTREPENLDESQPGFVGKQYVQEYFQSGKLAEAVGTELSPSNTHVFLCGNPSMIGYTPPGAPPLAQEGMLQILKKAGFSEGDDHIGAGSIQFEKYW